MLALLSHILVTTGSLCMFAGLYFPYLTIASYLFFRPLIQPFAWLQYKIYGLPIALPFTIIIIILGITLPLIQKPWSLTAEKSGGFILFFLVAVLSAGFSPYPSESVPSIAKLLTVWFLFIIAYNSVHSVKDAYRIIDALLISSVLPIFFGFYQVITGNYDMIHDAEVKRISSVFGTGNDYGIYLSFVTAAAVIRATTVKTRTLQLLMVIFLSLILVSQVLSLNRGTWIALSMGFVIAAVKYRKLLNFKLLAFGGLAFILIFSGKMVQRFQELKDPGTVHYSNTSTLEGRIGYWKALIPVIMERPIRGYGLGSSSLVTQKHLKAEHKVHNDYILLFLETGIFGLLAYITFLGRIFVYFLLRQITRELWIWNFAMLMLAIYFIVISGAQNIVQSIMNFPIFMILIAVAFKLNRISNPTGKKFLNKHTKYGFDKEPLFNQHGPVK